MTKLDQIEGEIYGLLIDDAVGVFYEFNLSEQLSSYEQIDMVSFPNFQKNHPNLSFGTWSDNDAQALYLLDSLLYKNQLDPEDFMNRMGNVYQHGYMAVDHQVFAVGLQTSSAINLY